jgi:hypothetical protein
MAIGWARLRRFTLRRAAKLDAAPRAMAPRAHASGTTAPRARSLDELMELMAGGTLRLYEAVIELADGDCDCDLAILLGRRTAAKMRCCLRQLFAPDEMPLMRLCRAAGLDLEAFSAVLRLRRRLLFGPSEIGRLLRAYRALAADGG